MRYFNVELGLAKKIFTGDAFFHRARLLMPFMFLAPKKCTLFSIPLILCATNLINTITFTYY